MNIFLASLASHDITFYRVTTNTYSGVTTTQSIMIQDNNITSTDILHKVPHLQITKHFPSDEEYKKCLKVIESSLEGRCLFVHYCDHTSTLKSVLIDSCSCCDEMGRISIGKVESLISKHKESGHYFVLTNFKPPLVDCRNKTVTLSYPLFLWQSIPNDSAKNIDITEGLYLKWFTLYQPHASHLLGLGMSQTFSFVLDEVSALCSFQRMVREAFISKLTDTTTKEVVGKFEYRVCYFHPSDCHIPILNQLEMNGYHCDGLACHTPVKEVCGSDTWECSYRV